MKIGKTWINRSIQNYKDVWGKFYIVADGEIVRMWVTRRMITKDDDWRMRFAYKCNDFQIYHDLDRHLVCYAAWQYGPSLMFKNFWFAHGYMNKLKRKK